VTITPEVLLHTARVIRCEGDSVVIHLLTPVLDEDEVGDEEYTWGDVIGADWRIISFGLS
jgi:hypothetical protein